MIKIEFPADRTDIALAIGQALLAIGAASQSTSAPIGAPSHAPANKQVEHYSQSSGTASTEIPPGDFGTADSALPSEDEDDDTGVPPVDGKLDLKGVAFNAQLCSTAKEPFYASGKDKGQWKCKKGVDRAQYDAWYAAELGNQTTNPAEEPKVDLGSVWQAPASQDAVKPPVNAGELFAYISEMQTAKRLTQADVDAAYPAVNLTVQQLWTADPATQSQMVAALFSYLSAKAAA